MGVKGSADRSNATSRLVAIRPGALGDTLLALPTLAWVLRQRASVHITLVARADVLPLARAAGLADETYTYDDPTWSALFAARPVPAGLAGEVCAGANVVAWLADDDGDIRRNLLAFGAWAAVAAPGKPRPTARAHIALLLARSLAAFGCQPPRSIEELMARFPPLDPGAETQGRVARWLCERALDSERLVAVHPGSGGAAKRWPPHQFAALMDRLAATGATPLLIEGPQDGEVARDTLAARMFPHDDRQHAARDLPIADLAALLARCAAYAGNDSGVTHLAALVGCPTLAIFGPTNPAVWRPLGPRVTTIRSSSRSVADVPLDEVWDALSPLIGG
ncbi:MAG: glycosyltransferase family 9 protein [Ktedonobacterales bacterium]